MAISRFGSLSDISLRDALRFYKLRPSQDVAIAQIGGLGERIVALTSGVVDAAIPTWIKSTKRKSWVIRC